MSKVVRSLLVRVPRAYEHLTSTRRYLVMHRLGMVHDPDFKALPRLVEPSALIVDAGGNLGQSILSIKTVLPEATVVTFEPNSELLEGLGRIQERFTDVRVEPIGLAAAHGTAELFVPVYNGKVMTGLASMDRDSAASWMNPRRVYGFRPDWLEIRRVPISFAPLDAFDLSADLIKIDVQGTEEEVVRGAWQTIQRHHPVLMIEAPSAALTDRLAAEGYGRWEHRGGAMRTSASVRKNQFFIHHDGPSPGVT